ncbi:hypothetical protein SE17_17340 [Kouleothrix aurantiaca]|uniref:Uncharacterized protein n=1 Tax=Kouleothrix aurantiaca TaxID=186479 RepID=A0A0P9FG88_9CHLR|nr:hypothetical protein SE17_17340 [Kouleothrix aurantiaca]
MLSDAGLALGKFFTSLFIRSYQLCEHTSTMWGFGGGEAAPEFSFSGAVPQHQKTKVIKQSWYHPR